MRKLLITLLVTLSTTVTFAQKFSGGLKTGLSTSVVMASLGNSTDEIGSPLTGFHVGAYGRLSATPFFRFQLEVVYNQLGGSFENLLGDKKFMGNTYDIKYTDRLNYLDIPLVFMLHGAMSSFQIGVQPSFLLSQSTEVEGTVTVDATGNVTSLEQQFGGDIENFRQYKSSDFSVLFGYMLDIPLGINVGFRVNYSLGNIYDISQPATNTYVITGTENNFDRFYRFDDARNVSAQLSVGYTFKKK